MVFAKFFWFCYFLIPFYYYYCYYCYFSHSKFLKILPLFLQSWILESHRFMFVSEMWFGEHPGVGSYFYFCFFIFWFGFYLLIVQSCCQRMISRPTSSLHVNINVVQCRGKKIYKCRFSFLCRFVFHSLRNYDDVYVMYCLPVGCNNKKIQVAEKLGCLFLDGLWFIITGGVLPLVLDAVQLERLLLLLLCLQTVVVMCNRGNQAAQQQSPQVRVFFKFAARLTANCSLDRLNYR